MTVVPYSVTRKDVWDAFVDVCRQGSFIFKRDFMDYHAERYFDCSVMVCQGLTEDDNYKENELHVQDVVAILPANWDEEARRVESHGGLSYGGLLTREDASQVDVLRCMQLVMKYYRNYLGAKELIYKPIPYIYSALPAEEDRYALFRAGATLERRMVSTVVDQMHALSVKSLKQDSAIRAVDAGFYIERVLERRWDVLEEFWSLLNDEESKVRGTEHLHSFDELKLLMDRFPKDICLLVVKNVETRIVAGVLVFETRQVAHIQYVAATREGRDNGALDLLFRHLIVERYKSMRYIDFGSSNSSDCQDLNEKMIFQKESFGGRAVCYDIYKVELKEFELGDMFRIDQGNAEVKSVKYLDLGKVTASFEPELGSAMRRVEESGWYLLGNENKVFAEAFAKYIGVKHCITTGNGLDALKIILRSLKLINGWKSGDGVLVQGNTYLATVIAIRDAGLLPVLYDVDANLCVDSNADLDKQKQYINIAAKDAADKGIKLRAIMPVHLYGRVWNMDVFRDVVEACHLIVVEDAAQIHGAEWKGKKSGALGMAAGWSFYPGKNLGALGDAGCITTDDDRLAVVAEKMRNYGFREKYLAEVEGVNSRMDELQAAVLGVKLRRLDADNARRRDIARMYIEGIDNPLLKLPTMPKVENECVWHVMPVYCAVRDRLKKYLADNGVESLIHYPKPPHMQSTWKGEHVDLGQTEKLAREELSLPIGPVMSDDEVKRVIDVCNDFV